MKVLKARSLGVWTSDGEPLLRDIDLEVGEGEFLLLCGKPGSGKTVLCKALKGIIDSTERGGEEGTGLKRRGAVERRGRVEMVFQDPARAIMRQKVERDVAFGLENAGLPREEMRERIHHYAGLLKARPLLQKGVEELSLGELTKVALLGALVLEPELIILDEPLASLDYESRGLLLTSLDRLKDLGKALIVAEHDLRELLGRAERVLLLQEGRISAEGKPLEMAGGLYDQGLKLPFKEELCLRLERLQSS